MVGFIYLKDELTFVIIFTFYITATLKSVLNERKFCKAILKSVFDDSELNFETWFIKIKNKRQMAIFSPLNVIWHPIAT